MGSAKEKNFIDIVVSEGFMAEAEIESVASDCKGLLGDFLLQKEMLTAEQLAQVYARQFDMPFIRLDEYTVRDDLYEILPLKAAIKFNAVPYDYDGNNLSVVIHDVFDVDIEEKLHSCARKNINLMLGLKSEIDEVLASKEGSAHLLKNVAEEFKPVLVQENQYGSEENISLELVDTESAPAIKIINSLIYAGLQKRASDIHIESYDYGIEIKYRIDGVLYPATERLDGEMHSSLVSRIKVMSSLDITEQQKPQDGRFKLKADSRSIDFRVSILPGVYGENINIRILDKEAIISNLQEMNLDNIGIEGDALMKFRKSVNEPHGMVLVTGPTGSGKTTTLYAVLSELNSGEEKIITIEDPVEYQLDGIVQIQVNEKKGMTFVNGLRSILRHDPDKILVGEIRDLETAQIAVQSALTGHLVFSSVHANTTFDVISRFINMGIDPNTLIPALNCVVSQRLIRKICKDCRTEYKPDADEVALSGLTSDECDKQQFFSGTGCPSCEGTGYRGRVAIHEILYISDKIGEILADHASLSEIKSVAKQEGMETIREAAIRKVYAGETTLHEINRVTFID